MGYVLLFTKAWYKKYTIIATVVACATAINGDFQADEHAGLQILDGRNFSVAPCVGQGNFTPYEAADFEGAYWPTCTG